jgi:hypothetical protein
LPVFQIKSLPSWRRYFLFSGHNELRPYICFQFPIPLIYQRISHLQRHILDELVIYLKHGRRSTRGKAFRRHQGIIAVGSRLAALDTQALLKMVDQFITAA